MKRKNEDIIQLVKNALSNNLSAQNNLYTIIYKHYRAQRINEDIINEIYFRFLKNAKIEEIYNENKLWGYLNHLKNSCQIDAFRRKKEEINLEDIGDGDNKKIYMQAIEEKTALDILIEQEDKTIDMLYETLDRFAASNKMLADIIVDYYLEDLNLSEISLKYDILYITAKNRLHRARKEIKKYFQKK